MRFSHRLNKFGSSESVGHFLVLHSMPPFSSTRPSSKLYIGSNSSSTTVVRL